MKKAFFIIVTAFLCASFSILFSACSRQTHREENFESVSIEKTITDNRHESSREEQVTIRETNCVHSWNEATCQEPKTCVLCGETDGEPLGHDLTAANYQQPETCARCGKSFGNVIPAYYDVNNLRSYVRGEYLTEKQLDDWSGSYSFTFICGYNKNNEPIHCKVSCEEKSDDLSLMRVASEYELSLDAEDGWRWRLIRVCMEIDTAELTEEGTNLSLVFFDRYTGLIEFHDKIVSSYYGNPIECPIISKGDTYIATTADNTVLQEIKLDYFIYQPMEYDGIGVAWYNRTVNEQGETKIVFSEVEEEQEVLDRVSQAGVFDPVIIPMLSGGMPARFSDDCLSWTISDEIGGQMKLKLYNDYSGTLEYKGTVTALTWSFSGGYFYTYTEPRDYGEYGYHIDLLLQDTILYEDKTISSLNVDVMFSEKDKTASSARVFATQ